MNRFILHLALAAGALAAAVLPATAGPRVPPPPYAASPNLPDGWRYDNAPRSRAAAPGTRGDRSPIWRNRGLFSSTSAPRRPAPSPRWNGAPEPRRSTARPPRPRKTYAHTTAPRQAAPRRQTKKRPQRKFDPAFLPSVVDYDGSEAPGTIIIDTPSRYLYLVQTDGTARRYGVGVGRPGFKWSGTHKVTRKAKWPEWRPPAEMRKRQPDLPTFMPGGVRNPLGARALYLGSTLYRIHGSNQPWTIGHAVSSGCIRMRNEDVEDLYARVDVGTKVIVN